MNYFKKADDLLKIRIYLVLLVLAKYLQNMSEMAVWVFI